MPAVWELEITAKVPLVLLLKAVNVEQEGRHFLRALFNFIP